MKSLVLIFVLLLVVSFGISSNHSEKDAALDNQAKVTINAEDTHLAMVLAILAEESGYNIVTGPKVNADDKLTIHMKDVPISQAINLVVRAAGLSYEIIGNSILVASKGNLDEEVGIDSHIITLKYANANDVKSLLVNITEQIEVDETGNRLLISTSPKKISEIYDIIKEVDVPAQQIMLEARLIEVALSDEQQLGIDWARLAKLTQIFAETGAPITLNGEETGSLVPGMTVATGQTGLAEETFSPLNTAEKPDQMYFQRLSGEPIRLSRQLTAFDVTLDLLLKQNKAELLANSQVVALNGKAATIEMVDVVPYVLSAGGVGGQVQVQREEVGIKLKILPIVNSDGYITTSITPEVSSIFDFIGPDENIPWVKRRTSTTTVRVRDGESIVIAGLLGANKINEEYKVPLLWRIPWLGTKLFTHIISKENKTDLIIQVTPHIVADNDTGIEKRDFHEEAEKMLPESESDDNK
ncbi:MAG: hypothetical protein GXO91_03460 [FCB group bacterium]|nr:hypothetical protein [FCB group bacterium]